VDVSGKIASFSSPGPTFDGRIKPEVCALGVSDWIAQNRRDGTDYYTTGSGTSYSTPLVGGAAALLLEAHPDWTPNEVRAALTNTGGNAASPNNDYGWGIINAPAAADYSASAPAVLKNAGSPPRRRP
jgi:serine protease AprX